MNASRLLIATACSLAVTGAASVAFAQTTTAPTTPTTPSSTVTNQNQGQSTGQMQGQTPSITTAPGSTTPGNMNSTTQRPYDVTTPGAGTSGAIGTTGTTGTAATRSNDGTMRSPSDRATMSTERAVRADRN